MMMKDVIMYRQKILIVDDAEINYEILAGMLEGNYETVYASDGDRAIKILEERRNEFGLVLLDLNMPVLDGYGVLKIMNERKWMETLPVIIISSESSMDFIGRAYDLGAADYFVRPFDARIILKRVRNMIELYERDYQDNVIDGYNRKGVIRQADILFKYCEDGTQYAIMFFNIRNFKVINELFDVEGGDDVLRHFYNRIMISELKPLIGARIEADHFVFVVRRENINLDRLTALCECTFRQHHIKQRIYCRCGVFYVEDKNMSVSGMIDRAKIAKEYITDEYVKPYAVFDKFMRAAYIDKAKIASELEDALINNEFKVYFQPVVNPMTGKLASAEALVRWQHPEKGFISPALFVPALEKSGYISKLDRYVYKQVRQFLGERYENRLPIVPVSTNLSWMDFYDEDMMNWIVNDMCEFTKPKELVRFEITETSYTAIEANRNKILEKLREYGATILMDDFGSGYSSFGLLQDYNFDILKIDMQFTRQVETNPKTRIILHSIIEMAHSLGIKVIAEGAETEAQVAFLKEDQCDYIQGYYYSKPVPMDEFVKMLRKDNIDESVIIK